MIKNVTENIWGNVEINDGDVDYLINHLFEIETPLNAKQLVEIFIKKKIDEEKENQKKLAANKGVLYKPSDDYAVGQELIFSEFNYDTGTVLSKREGNNPNFSDFSVIEVKFSEKTIRQFACNLEEHNLNQEKEQISTDQNLDFDYVYSNYRKIIRGNLDQTLSQNDDLVQIAGYWFPESLLVDVNIGYLNLAEAVLEMAEGGPLPTGDILEQIELPSDANSILTEFSLNYALQEDERFDEVGASGKTLWFLHRLEPDAVKTQPKHLVFDNDLNGSEKLDPDLVKQLTSDLYDELEEDSELDENTSDLAITIIYPHLVSGTLPLSQHISDLFPTAYEAPRIRFTFVDGNSKVKFPGWVVREGKYVFGLDDWYKENDIVPGSTIFIKRSKTPGEMIISTGKKRNTREWVKTANVTQDDQIRFSMDQQLISTQFDDRMVIAVPNMEAIERLWKKYETYPVEKVLPIIIRELSKLTPQGNVHSKEIYAALNILKRCSPSYTLYLLEQDDSIEHLGDSYFKITQ